MNMMKFTRAMVILLAVSSVYAAETSDPNAPTTLQAYLHVALAHNAGLQSRFSEYKAALAMVPQAAALDDPQFTYGYWLRQMETQEKQRFGIMQMLPWFGTLEARTDAAAASARAAGRRFEAARLELTAKIKTAYYEFAYLGRAFDIAQDNLELLRHFEQVVQSRYRTAAATHPDIIRAQIELAMLEDEWITLGRKKKPVVEMVNSVLNRVPESDFPWPKQAQLPVRPIDEAQVVAAMMDNNPELAAMGFEIAAARSGVELAQKRSRPNISLGLEWMQMDKASMPGGHRRDAYLAMVSINLPLWTSSYNAGVQEAQAKALGTLQNKTQRQSDLAAQAAELMFAVEDSRRKATLYQEVLIPKAKEMLDVSEQAYRTGAIDFLSLIDAQRKLLEFELSYERVLADHLVSLAQLEPLVGGYMPIKEE